MALCLSFSMVMFSYRQRLVEALCLALARSGIDDSKYSGHSFRIGAATTAASKGVENCIIKTLGRWTSLAYLEYVKIPRVQIAEYSRVLVSLLGVFSFSFSCRFYHY